MKYFICPHNSFLQNGESKRNRASDCYFRFEHRGSIIRKSLVEVLNYILPSNVFIVEVNAKLYIELYMVKISFKDISKVRKVNMPQFVFLLVFWFKCTVYMNAHSKSYRHYLFEFNLVSVRTIQLHNKCFLVISSQEFRIQMMKRI